MTIKCGDLDKTGSLQNCENKSEYKISLHLTDKYSSVDEVKDKNVTPKFTSNKYSSGLYSWDSVLDFINKVIC